MIQRSHQHLDAVRDQLLKLVAENEQLKSQIHNHRHSKRVLIKLQRLDRDITYKVSRLASRYHDNSRDPPDCSLWFARPATWKRDDEGDRKWFKWVEQELALAREARKSEWKEQVEKQQQELKAKGLALALKSKRRAEYEEKIDFLQRQIHRERQERQTSAAVANSTIADLRRKNEELQEQIQEREESEKHCHHVLNHLEKFIEAHPGEAGAFKGLSIRARTNEAVAKKAVEWFDWADDKIRMAQDLDEVTSRSAKRRKTRIPLTVNEHDQEGYHGPATVRAIESATENVPMLCKTVSDQIHVSIKQAQTSNSAATRSPPGHVSGLKVTHSSLY